MDEETFPVSYVLGKTTNEYSFDLRILAKDENVLEELLKTLCNVGD